ncbi:MAG TPA: CPBP family intramembrane glutamic endopeptidase [Anaerolineaceae bacterium]
MRLNQLRMDWKVVTVIVISTLVLVIDHYHSFFSLKVYDRTLLYFVIPFLTITLVFRQSPSRYGITLGDWKAGLLLTIGGCTGMTLIMLVVARTGDFKGYYAPLTDSPLPLPLQTALDLFGWEFLFRGFLLFSLYSACGPYAIILQAVPFTIAHFGKPELETLSCIFGGSAFGYVAWRTRSFIYPFLIHWFLSTITILLAAR